MVGEKAIGAVGGGFIATAVTLAWRTSTLAIRSIILSSCFFIL